MMLRVGIARIALGLLLSLGGSAASKSVWDSNPLDEDELFWGRLLGGGAGSLSMSMSIDECVDNFDAIQTLVEESKHLSSTVSIRLCKDSKIEFDSVIDVTGAKFAMLCENNDCRLDGQGKTNFFKAGRFGGPLSTHDISFDTIHFLNGKTTSGGGAFDMFGGRSRFNECAFLNNVASDGGAMRIQDGHIDISRCLFQNNSAEDVGGAMKVEESEAGILDMTIRDSTFTGNVAGTEGDDIYQDNAERGSIDCGEGSGNKFCDASSSDGISTNWPETTCAGASTEECAVVDHKWNVVELN